MKKILAFLFFTYCIMGMDKPKVSDYAKPLDSRSQPSHKASDSAKATTDKSAGTDRVDEYHLDAYRRASDRQDEGDKTEKNRIPSLRTLCLEQICISGMPRTPSSNNLLEQIYIQENVYKFYLSRDLSIQNIERVKSLVKRGIPPQNSYRLIPALFQKWSLQAIKRWKAAAALEPFTSLIKLIIEKEHSTKEELFCALNVTMKEQLSSYALPSFLIQVALDNDLSSYPHGNIIVFPKCSESPTLEQKLFIKTIIFAKISIEEKNSMLRRAAHEKITHNQAEYEQIINWLIENGADKTILSSYEQKNLSCAIQN